MSLFSSPSSSLVVPHMTLDFIGVNIKMAILSIGLILYWDEVLIYLIHKHNCTRYCLLKVSCTAFIPHFVWSLLARDDREHSVHNPAPSTLMVFTEHCLHSDIKLSL